MAKFRIDYFLTGKGIYGRRRIEKEFNSSKEALLWCAENLSDKSTCFEVKKLPEKPL